MAERMRVLRQDELGGPEVLHLVEVDRPEPIATEVQVQVHAAGVNPTDVGMRIRNHWGWQLPFVLGYDVSGVVTELGVATSLFEVGDEVLGMPWFPRQAGGYGEYVTAPARQFVRKPAALSHIEAAALPLAGLTAWQALVDMANVGPGQRVLVTAAAGGVGHLAVQIAKARGAYVIGTASAAKHEFLYGLGVDEAVDYRTGQLADQVKDVDVALELAGGDNVTQTLPTVREGGLMIQIAGALVAVEHPTVRIRQILVEPDHAGLLGLVDLVERGQLRVHVQETFPLAEAGRAHDAIVSRGVTGKLVLRVR